jgi:hypothetical protein
MPARSTVPRVRGPGPGPAAVPARSGIATAPTLPDGGRRFEMAQMSRHRTRISPALRRRECCTSACASTQTNMRVQVRYVQLSSDYMATSGLCHLDTRRHRLPVTSYLFVTCGNTPSGHAYVPKRRGPQRESAAQRGLMSG